MQECNEKRMGAVWDMHTSSTDQLLIGNSFSVLLLAVIYMQYISVFPPQCIQ